MVLAMMEDVKLFIVSKQKTPYVALCFHYRHIITAQLLLQQCVTLQTQSLSIK